MIALASSSKAPSTKLSITYTTADREGTEVYSILLLINSDYNSKLKSYSYSPSDQQNKQELIKRS
jgi:hypothetical protein